MQRPNNGKTQMPGKTTCMPRTGIYLKKTGYGSQ